MGKKSRRKLARRKLREAVEEAEKKANSQPPKRKKRLGAVVALLAAIVTVIGIITYIEPIHRLFMSDREKYEADNFVNGDLKPPPLDSAQFFPSNPSTESQPKTYRTYTDTVPNAPHITGILLGDTTKSSDVYFLLGANRFGVDRASLEEKGYNITKQGIRACGDIDLVFGVKENRLYVSTEFKSILNVETIGIIDFNHWRLFKPNLLTFNNDDERLEVRDRQDQIVFTIKYIGNNEVSIGGYLISPESVFVILNHKEPPAAEHAEFQCFPFRLPNWKTEAIKYIREIKSNF